MRLGIDVGSTTVKIVLIDENEKVIYQRYERHMSSVFDKVRELLEDLIDTVGDIDVKCVITGSGGLALAEKIGARFEQEVVTCSLAVEKLIPQTDVAIELGGEDAKITYFGSAIEQRMNGTCAGGTGAFIDQMAILLSTDGEGLNEGAPLSNLAASIFQAVVNQTISGLACGHKIKGNVAFLGGPLTYMSELRNRFIQTLGLKPEEVIFPENSKYFVALGAAFTAEKSSPVKIGAILNKVKHVDALSMAGA